jgi:hypothetical protein
MKKFDPKQYQRSQKGKEVQKRYASTENGKRVRRDNCLRSKYKITLEHYNKVLEQQNGVCAICKNHETARNQFGIRFLSVDHNHKTNKIRGLLCDRCNRMIGFAQENSENLIAGAIYLEKHK